jgi:hypothetical protein
MIVKIHKTPDGRIILAVCDSEILGKKFEEKGLQLDLSSDFFKGNEMKEEEIISLFKKAYIVNLNGEKAVKLGVREGVVSEVIRIKGIPHAEGVVVGG